MRMFLQAEEETMERLRAQETGIFRKPSDLKKIFNVRSDLILLWLFVMNAKCIFKKADEYLQCKQSLKLHFFLDVQSKVSDVVLGKEKPVEESDPDYKKPKHYIFELENHLAEAQKHAYHLVKSHREFGQSLSDFGKLLGASEGNSLGKAFSELGINSDFIY